ncbi:MAG: nicotinate (nicotinamide) nucleotide adenylyltransferase [Chlamydiales bacterium]|nr:nicotinate (nicotinamide) nucleotide adenylyltransferase [Chlamydiales bacterium]
MKRKIGLYGGTFNPVHFGHLNLAFELMEKAGLDEVWWIPTNRSPLRADEMQVDPSFRFKMVELAVEGIPQFKVLSLEAEKTSPSYTIDTVREILKLYPQENFFLLLGEDSLTHFMAWKDPLELVRHLPLLIAGRSRVEFPHFPEEIQAAIDDGMVETCLFDISATRIRERLEKKLYTAHLIPAKVLDFIYVNQLYFTA